MLFVEGFRFLFTLIGAVGGYEVGNNVSNGQKGQLIGLVLGAAVFYVVGGVVGRLLDRGLQTALFQARNMPPGEAFAGVIVGTSGLLLGVVIGLPLLVLFRSGIVLIVTALICWVLAFFGWRIGVAKGRQVVAAAGLSRILAPPTEAPPGYALLIDSSAMMDRFLLVLGRVGLLPGGIVIPRFVVDHVKTLADGPDPVTSRRARRALEAVEALRDVGVDVHVSPDEIPEADDETTKLLTLARRLGLRVGTCSAQVAATAGSWDLPAVDLRRLVNDLTPDHPPGEQLIIDLVKEGSQARQAVGYLPDGDMVVVNDASHLIGENDVRVSVLSTRPTNRVC